MLTTTGTVVHVMRHGGAWTRLNGYAGGILLGMASDKLPREGDDDGITRYIKGGAGGAESQIAVRLIEGDPGQVLLRDLARFDSNGMGSVRVTYPQGLTLSADGVFHGLSENAVDPDEYQGFKVTFTQNEPENRA